MRSAGSATRETSEPERLSEQSPADAGATSGEPENVIVAMLETVGGRLLFALILTVFLAGWSMGVYLAFTTLLDMWGSGGAIFLMVWLAVAAFGWVMAATFLYGIVASFFVRDDA